MKKTDAVANGTAETAGVDGPTLVELLANKAEYTSVKQQAYLELKRFSRQLRGVMLLVDDLAGLASIDEAAGKVRLEHAGLLARRDGLATEIASSQAEAKSLADRNAALSQQVAEVSERLEALSREERRLAPVVAKYQSLEQAIGAAEQHLAELQSEEARLKPLVREYHDIERKLPEAEQRLSNTERRLAEIRRSA